jgi:hypothetical protein
MSCELLRVLVAIKRSIRPAARSLVPLVLAALAATAPLFALPAGVGPLTFADEFDGPTLDAMKWIYRQPGPRNDACNTPNAVSVGGGLLTIKT